MNPEEFLQGGEFEITPEEFGDFTVEQPELTGADKQMAIAEKLHPVQNFGVGAIKGAGSTVLGLSQLGQKALQQTGGRVVEALTGKPKEELGRKEYMPGMDENTKLRDLVTPEGGFQKAGFVAEKIAEFIAPSGGIAKIQKVATGAIGGTGVLAGTARAGVKAGIEGIASGGIALGQQGEMNDEVKTAALLGSAFSLAGSTISGLGDVMKKGGEKILFSKIRPGVREVKDGFDIANVKKYGLGGSLDDMNLKTQTALNTRIKQLNDTLKEAQDYGGGNVLVDPYDALQKTVREFQGTNKAASFGENKAITRVLRSLKGELDEVAGGERMGLYDATLVKRGAGTKGAWAYGRVEPDAGATEQVYSTFYRHMKDLINRGAPPEVKALNKEITDLIPISNAIIRRIPVEARNNAISLTDSMALLGAAFDPNALLFLGASKLSKSGRFANFLIQASENMRKPTSAIGQRLLGAGQATR